MMNSFDYVQCEEFYNQADIPMFDPDQAVIDEEMARQAYVQELLEAEQSF